MNFISSLRPLKFFVFSGIPPAVIAVVINAIWIDPENGWMDWPVPFVLGLFIGWTLALYFKIFVEHNDKMNG